jgi:hypothetical protein
VRDAEVRLQTVRQLQEITRRTSQQTFRKTEELLLAELDISWPHLRTGKNRRRRSWRKLQEEIAGWPVESLDCKNIRCTAQRAYKAARHAWTAQKPNRRRRIFHEFRSEAKRLLYQLRILRPNQSTGHRRLDSMISIR